MEAFEKTVKVASDITIKAELLVAPVLVEDA